MPCRVTDRDPFDVAVVCVLPDTPSTIPHASQRIRIGPRGDADTQESPDVWFVTPMLASDVAARVMRFDGSVHGLCNERADAVPDPTPALFDRLRQACAALQ